MSNQSVTSKRPIYIGGASGYWGESDMAVPQFLGAHGAGQPLDYIVFDYLAEITMSILARQRQANPQKGYAQAFITEVLTPHLQRIAKSGIKLISNAGGMNPESCAQSIKAAISAAGLDLKVGVISGDDILPQLGQLSAAQPPPREMFSGMALPPHGSIASANAYLGAFPIAKALGMGADIIVTGRVVDSAVTLGACIHEFGWGRQDYDLLASGSLAGHILECGPQATGGNFTDWQESAENLDRIGYPIACVHPDGSFELTKPEGTGGLVSIGTVGEQMLYEIGDPQNYILPDVICDFSQVKITQRAADHVHISPAIGRAAPRTLKACLTYHDGWKIASVWMFVGEKARAKGQAYAQAALARTRAKLKAVNAPDFSDVHIEFFGDNSHYGAFKPEGPAAREVVMKLAARHRDKSACALLYREATGLALATPAGLAPLAISRPKPSPVMSLFSMAVPKSEIKVGINAAGQHTSWTHADTPPADTASDTPPVIISPPTPPQQMKSELKTAPLYTLAFGRSGDKGDKANIGIFPRAPEFTPYIWHALSLDVIKARFAHFNSGKVERFFLPGTQSMNIVLHNALGGGGMASLRNDTQGKTFAQILLQTPITYPAHLAPFERGQT